MHLSLHACAQVDFLWSEAEGGRSKGTLVMFFNSPASAALLWCVVPWHSSSPAFPLCVLDVGRGGEVVTQHQDPPSALQTLLANALCPFQPVLETGPGPGSVIAELKSDVRNALAGLQVCPAAPSSSVLPVWTQ